jgi:hypothetical protein
LQLEAGIGKRRAHMGGAVSMAQLLAQRDAVSLVGLD